MHEKLIDIIDKFVEIALVDPTNSEATKTYEKYSKQCLTVKCIILASMNPNLQMQHENMNPYEIIKHLIKMYDKQSRIA